MLGRRAKSSKSSPTFLRFKTFLPSRFISMFPAPSDTSLLYHLYFQIANIVSDLMSISLPMFLQSSIGKICLHLYPVLLPFYLSHPCISATSFLSTNKIPNSYIASSSTFFCHLTNLIDVSGRNSKKPPSKGSAWSSMGVVWLSP